jgi:hypothetical protein
LIFLTLLEEKKKKKSIKKDKKKKRKINKNIPEQKINVLL